MNIMAFDLGGSGGKMFLGSYENGKIGFKTVHRFENEPIPAGDGLYWDFLLVWKELIKGISSAVRETGDDISCLGIDTFCNDYCIVSKSGELLTQMHSYRDERTVRLEKEIYSVMGKRELYFTNGNQIAPFNTLMQLACMKIEGQDALFKNNKLLFLPDLLIYYLSGKPYTEYTIASVTQMYNYHTDDFDKNVLEKYDIPKELFYPIVKPGTINAKTSDKINRLIGTKGFKIANVCEHDTGSAFLASISEKEHMILSCGTWAIAGCESENPVINEVGFEYNIANEGSVKGHHRILKNTMGTWIIQQIRSRLKSEGMELSYAEMEKKAQKAEPFKWIIDVDDQVFYAPENMCEALRTYCDEHYGSHPKTAGEMVRCVYESLALKYRWCMEKLEQLTGRKFEEINIIGGGSQSDMMCSMTAKACRLDVLAGPVEATALGNMITQLLALKEIESVEEGRKVIRKSFKYKKFVPDDSDIWDEQYKIFVKKFDL